MKLLIIDHKARSTRGMPIHQVAAAELIVGKDRLVLKGTYNGHMELHTKLTAKELAAVREDAETIIERG